MSYPDNITASTAPDRAPDTSGPFDGFENLALEHMPRLRTIVEEWRSDLEREGVDVSDLLTAAEAIEARAQEWLGVA